MFVKVTAAGGKRYAQLVESFRKDGGPSRHRIIATLGRLEPGGAVDRLIESLQRAQGRDGSAPPVPATQLEFLEARSAGDVWALWHLWHSLGLEDLPAAWGRTRSGIDVLACLRLMVFNRLCDPSSKLGCCAGCRRWRCRGASGLPRARPTISICCGRWTYSTTMANPSPIALRC
jgi:hypothetical protein